VLFRDTLLLHLSKEGVVHLKNIYYAILFDKIYYKRKNHFLKPFDTLVYAIFFSYKSYREGMNQFLMTPMSISESNIFHTLIVDDWV